MINTCVDRAIALANGFIVVKLHFLNFIYLACMNYIEKYVQSVFFSSVINPIKKSRNETSKLD